jgi:hypothetical protein
MKCRLSFVTNSSSTSYVLAMKPDFKFTTTDDKLKDFIKVLSEEYSNLFEQLSYNNDDYDIKYYKTLEDVAKHILENCYQEDLKRKYREVIKQVKNHKGYMQEFVDEKLLFELIKDYEGTSYNKAWSYVQWITQIKQGNVVCIMSSSHHNRLICALMWQIMGAEGVLMLEDRSG